MSVLNVERAECMEDEEIVIFERSLAKFLDLKNKIVDACLELFGSYGYTNEYPIARMFWDSRVQRIYGGANGQRDHEGLERAHSLKPLAPCRKDGCRLDEAGNEKSRPPGWGAAFVVGCGGRNCLDFDAASQIER